MLFAMRQDNAPMCRTSGADRAGQAGDQDAAAELVRDYEPACSPCDSHPVAGPTAAVGVRHGSDICQSVMASFFARLSPGTVRS